MLDKVKGAVGRWLPLLGFKGSESYWRARYRFGGDSGAGSGGEAAQYKAQVLNDFVRQHAVESVIEFGCGDGRQLELAVYPKYLGLDISPKAVELCRRRFADDPGKSFGMVEAFPAEQADLALSLDVLFHLVEDQVYYGYLDRLFAASRRFVIIYSSNDVQVSSTLPHVRHRKVSEDVDKRFPDCIRMVSLEDSLPSPPSLGHGPAMVFLMYEKQGDDAVVSPAA